MLRLYGKLGIGSGDLRPSAVKPSFPVRRRLYYLQGFERSERMMIKLVFCLRRLESLTREEFQEYWRNTHGPLVRERAAAIGAIRYVQLHTSYDEMNELVRAGRGGPEPFDGIAELWFESPAALQASLGTKAAARAGAELLEDERKFIDLERSPIWFADEVEVVSSES